MSDDPIFAITCLANAIFGGSIGALITWELCHAMDERGQCIGAWRSRPSKPAAPMHLKSYQIVFRISCGFG
jgi:surfactin synthase thioesterase subunit